MNKNNLLSKNEMKKILGGIDPMSFCWVVPLGVEFTCCTDSQDVYMGVMDCQLAVARCSSGMYGYAIGIVADATCPR